VSTPKPVPVPEEEPGIVPPGKPPPPPPPAITPLEPAEDPPVTEPALPRRSRPSWPGTDLEVEILRTVAAPMRLGAPRHGILDLDGHTARGR